MHVDAMSFLLNEAVWLKSKTAKILYYIACALILNLLLNALNFGMLIIWIIELKVGL